MSVSSHKIFFLVLGANNDPNGREGAHIYLSHGWINFAVRKNFDFSPVSAHFTWLCFGIFGTVGNSTS